MAGVIYKPQTRKGPVFLSPVEGPPPTITLPNGRVITAVRADQAGGAYRGHEGYQWVFPRDVLGHQGAVLTFNGQSQQLGNTNMSYRGGGVGGLAESGKGAIGDFSSGGFGGFGATPVGSYGFAPANMMGSFPSPFLANYQPIAAAPYKFTDVKKFAKQYGEFNRGEILKNYGLSKELSVDTLDTELASLKAYVPAAAALKRQETAADNIFNQQQRTQQLDLTLPGVRTQLANQGQRAETFAQGRIPDAIEDRAFEVGVRSGAADIANAGGFGARSSVARKASDLMSAKERIQLSQYGDQLLSGNINQRVNVEMAPTSYSNAGQQVNVMPSLSFSQLSQSNLGQLNQLTTMPTTTAFSGQVQQNQFATNLEQQTRQFNASNQLQTELANVATQNQFALGQFGYGVNLAGAYAGAAQTNLNTEVGFQQQQQAKETYQTALNKTQDANQIGSIIGGISTILSAANTLYGTDGGGEISSTASSLSDVDVSTAPVPPEIATRSFTRPAVAAATIEPEVAQFQQTAGVDVSAAGVPITARALADTSNGVLRTAGVYTEPQAGSVPLGVNTRGAVLYTDPKLATNQDVTAGARLVQGVETAVDPFNVLSDIDRTNLKDIAQAASDVSVITALTDAAQRGDQKAFINTVLAVTKQPAIEKLSSFSTDPTNKSKIAGGVGAAYTATALFQNWNQLSPAQKSLSLASLGIQGYQTASGTNLAKTPIIKPTADTPGLTVGQGLSLLQAGYNTYSLVKNWDQLNTLQKVTGVTGDVAHLASLAKSMNVLGYGPQGAAVPGVTAESLAALNATPAPSYGIGAISVPSGSAVPAGYTTIASEGGTTVAIPQANAASAAPSMLQTAGGVASLAAGAYTVYKGWGGSGTKGVTNGALGGSAMAAGLYMLGATNPFLLAGVVAASVLGNATGGGKSEAQQGRDAVRSRLKEVGLADKKYQVTLADGTVADIGTDGHGGYHTITDESRLSKDHKGKVKKLSAYDVDYTNDLDYAAHMGGATLSRLISGGSGKSIDQLGGQLGNASIKNIGFNKEMSPENYDKMIRNQRAMYAQAGIKSKTEAYQLANQAFAEGRINEIEHTTALQALNMIFDNNSYDLAKKLMAGRDAGINAAKPKEQKQDKPEQPVNRPMTFRVGEPVKDIKVPRFTKAVMRRISESSDWKAA